MLENYFCIQPMSVTDLDEVVAVEADCSPQPWSACQFLEELDNSVARVDLLRAEGQLCGFICYWLVAGELQILNVATAPGWRRRGVAGRLLTHAIDRCFERGLESVWLEVRVGNAAAISLYRRYGFVGEGCRKGYYRDGEDALLMVLDEKSGLRRGLELK